jgi:K+-transporting ATPase c subunit
MDLTFDTLYDQPSSTAAVAGMYLDSQAEGFPIFIDTDGSIQQSELICQNGGHISLIDASYNLYRIQLTSRCDNGSNSSVSGLATLDNSASPVHLLIGSSGGGAAGVSTWIRQ